MKVWLPQSYILDLWGVLCHPSPKWSTIIYLFQKYYILARLSAVFDGTIEIIHYTNITLFFFCISFFAAMQSSSSYWLWFVVAPICAISPICAVIMLLFLFFLFLILLMFSLVLYFCCSGYCSWHVWEWNCSWFYCTFCSCSYTSVGCVWWCISYQYHGMSYHVPFDYFWCQICALSLSFILLFLLSFHLPKTNLFNHYNHILSSFPHSIYSVHIFSFFSLSLSLSLSLTIFLSNSSLSILCHFFLSHTFH